MLASRAQLQASARRWHSSASACATTPRHTARRSVDRSLRPAPVCSSSSAEAAAETLVSPTHPITLTDKALARLKLLKAENANPAALLLRVGVRSGGCSGMSYEMQFEERANVTPDDMVIQYDDGIEVAVNPKSLLYLFGMKLDYSDALIGGGFQFQNPNATESCGCGKSFNA